MKKIIHIDNSEFFRKVMRGFLEKEGFEVESFDSAEDADIAISGGQASMVIAGLAIAGVEGDAFIRRIVQSYAGPLLVVSSSVDQDREAALRALGVRAAIGKSGHWQEALKTHLAALG